jgi:hypothetical protein
MWSRNLVILPIQKDPQCLGVNDSCQTPFHEREFGQSSALQNILILLDQSAASQNLKHSMLSLNYVCVSCTKSELL